MKCVSANELKSCSGRLIDVRSEAEFAGERLARAENVPLNRLGAAAAEWNRREPLVLMCAAGVRSRDAMNLLAGLGFTNLTMIEGGLKACKSAGLDVIVEKRTIPIIRQVLLVAGVLVLSGLLLAREFGPYFLALPLLVGCGMVFSGLTGICPMFWVLSQMPWNQVAGCSSKTCRVV